MGLPFSVLNKLGVPGLSSMTTGQIYDRYFKNEKTDTFQNFHVAYVEFCKYFNIIMPGQDFDTPSRTEIEEFFKEWNKLTDADKKTRFIGYMEEKVTVATVDDRLFIVAGLAAPAAAIVAKRTTENIPQVKKLKLHYVPNVVFVPVCTLLAIMGASALQMSKKSKESAIQMSKKSEEKPA